MIKNNLPQKAQDITNIVVKQAPHMSWMHDSLMYLTRHGSHAYNLNTPKSDEDFKGFCIPPKRYYLGSQDNFEQAELKNPNPDFVCYEINKFIGLACNNNPSVLEVLFTDPAHVIYINPLIQPILDNRDKFLSLRVKNTFGGFAAAQLHRMESHRKWLLSPRETKPERKEFGLPEKDTLSSDEIKTINAAIEKEMNKTNYNFIHHLDDATRLGIKSATFELMQNLKINSDEFYLASAREANVPSNMIEYMKQYRQWQKAIRDWESYQDWKKNRNPERAALEAKVGYDAKHGCHMVRLLSCAIQMIETGKLTVACEGAYKDHLLDIKHGKVAYDDLIAEGKQLMDKMNDLYRQEKQLLPQIPDVKFINELTMNIIEQFLFENK